MIGEKSIASTRELRRANP